MTGSKFQTDDKPAPREAKRVWQDAKRDIHGPVSHREGPIARGIEHQTARLPSDVFLWAAGASLLLKLSGRNSEALFVGQWAPTILILGVYNKLVKQAGSDGPDSRYRTRY